MTHYTTTIGKSETLSEQEFFADVLDTEFYHYSITGKRRDSDDDALTLRTALSYSGDYGDLDFVSSMLIKQISSSTHPEFELFVLVKALEGMVHEYRIALEAFRDFKEDRLIDISDDEYFDQRFMSEVKLSSKTDEWIVSKFSETAADLIHEDGQEALLVGKSDTAELRPKPRIRVRADGSFHFVC